MKFQDSLFRLGLVIGVICLIFSGCEGLINFGHRDLITISAPDELSEQVGGVHFHLVKRAEAGTKVAVIDLCSDTPHVYHFPNFLSRVDLSPDGSQLVYTQVTEKNGIQPIWLYHIDLVSGQESIIAGWDKNYDQVAISNPSFTSNGTQVLFSVAWYDAGSNGLARVNTDGSDLQVLETNLPLSEAPESSPDDLLIAVTCGGKDIQTGVEGFQLCLLDNKGKFIKYLTQSGTGHGGYAFTPDGKKIVYTEHDFGGLIGIINRPKDRLIIRDLESWEFTQLLDWQVEILGFSPDGSEIIISGRRNTRTTWKIYIMEIEGRDLRHLAYLDSFLEAWYADTEQSN